jgi:flavorubredoxin
MVEWNVRDFLVYFTKHGTTYNAYLIREEKLLVVTVNIRSQKS